jgi:predicted Rossmann fold flavoprotein
VDRTPNIEAPPGPRFAVATTEGTFRCESLVVATGGLAVPKLGATPFGYRIADQFGISVVGPRPGLVPLALADADRTRLAELSGVAFAAIVSCRGADAPAFDGSVLITHQGLSGPAVLQISNYWPGHATGSGADPRVALDLLPGIDAARWLQSQRDGRTTIAGALASHLPRRFAQAWAAMQGIDRPINQMTRADATHAAACLKAWELTPSGTLGFEKAEVTLGGIDTSELSSKTMESARVPGLFFIGEVVDVTGWLGGYNFQWAWSSGWAAGQAA